MPELLPVQVPDIGEFEDVDVVEVLVAVGDRVEAEQSLIVLESDKATMEVPCPRAGRVRAIHVAIDTKVSQGDPILDLEVEGTSAGAPEPEPTEPAATEPTSAPVAPAPAPPAPAPSGTGGGGRADVVVLGAGPGGYTAAFRAADLGKRVVLVERYPELGGVCLNVGCIPSKTLLHVAGVLDEVRELESFGVDFGEPRIDLERLRARKREVVGQLTGGLRALARQRKVEVVTGSGAFTGAHELEVQTSEGARRIGFEHAIIAAGSQATRLPGLPDDPRVLDSTAALELADVPERLLVIGGGIIGLEMATVYDGLGSKVTVVELEDRLMLEADRDLVRPLEKRIRARYEAILLSTRVSAVRAEKDGLCVAFEGEHAPDEQRFDRVLVAVGRRPNGDRIGAERAGVRVDERGFIPVDASQRTNVAHIHAIGDIVGAPQLAHKATHQGKVAAEVIAGLPASFDPRSIPGVAYTDPEVAWTGLTEEQARAEGIAIRKGLFPWSASGRALGMGRGEGLTKLLFSAADGRLLGAGISGAHAGELIGEATLALELGADAEDLGLTIHPHPTLSETVAFAAEMAAGTITDLLPPRRRS